MIETIKGNNMNMYSKSVLRYALIGNLIAFARGAHAGQTRRGNGENYINHPLRVADAYSRVKGAAVNMKDEEFSAYAAAILHDVLEDTKATKSDIFQVYHNTEMFDLIKELTTPKGLSKADEMKFTLEASSAAMEVKLCDIYDNLRDVDMYGPGCAWKTREKALNYLNTKAEYLRNVMLMVHRGERDIDWRFIQAVSELIEEKREILEVKELVAA